MKMSRLLIYATAGIVAGLLLENKIIKVKNEAGEKGRKLKKKASEMLPGKN